MKYRTSILFGLICLIAIAAVPASSQAMVESFNSLSRHEMELVLADVAKTNPATIKKLAEDPEVKRKQVENMKQLLAFACAALEDDMASDPTNQQELDNIRNETIAMNYDKEINKGKAAMTAFGYITEDRVKQFWSDQTHETEFQRYLETKISVLRANDPKMADREISEEEKTVARDMFAKISIYKDEFELKAKNGTLSKEVIDKASLQVKLQQAQFLAKLYSEKAAEQTKVNEKELTSYIAAHPKFKRSAARKELETAKENRLFAELIAKHNIHVAADFTVPTKPQD